MDRELRDRWDQLVGLLGIDEAEATRSLRDLWRRHDEAHRAFHTLVHVRHVLDVVTFLRDHEPVKDPVAIQLGAWFHDAVHDPARDDNEVASARLAGETLLAWDINEERTAHVVDLVLATATHTARHPDEAVLIDADLAVLSSDPERYDLYRRAVRVEYGHLDDAAWREGRAAFIRAMLARQSIFTTATMRERGEEIARSNLRAELEGLG